MSFSQRLLIPAFKILTSAMCRIDDAELVNVPQQGPLILYANHVNMLEIPILYTHLQPRQVLGMALSKQWDNPVLRWLLDSTESIPLNNRELDITAMRLGLEVLRQGKILMIDPEGTRSHTGILQPAHPGVVLLALHSGAPLMPVAYYGAEHYTENLKHLKRSDFHIRVGPLFHLDSHGEKVTHHVRAMMLEEMMLLLASLLPPEYRGVYSDLSKTDKKYLVFD